MVSRMNDCQLLFDVGGTFLKAVIADSDRKLIEDAEYEVPMPSSGSRDEIIGALVTAVTRGAALAEERGMRIAGVAVDFPGPFDYNAGMSLMEHKFQSIRNVNLTDILKSHPALGSDVPVRFLHDVNAALAGEMMCGNARDFRNAALVTLGTGLGFACCIDSVLQLNPYGSPLISIFRMPYGSGILEDFVSKRGITRLYREMSGCVKNDITVAEIASAAFEGDDAARRAFAEAGGILGRVLAPILAENNIECLLCGGQISKSFELFGPTLSENLKDVAQPRLIAPAKNITTAPFYGLLASLIQESSR